MSTIKIENLNFSYYGYVKPVFENVSFSFDTNWKIGLIGRNGISKSTLATWKTKATVSQIKSTNTSNILDNS